MPHPLGGSIREPPSSWGFVGSAFLGPLPGIVGSLCVVIDLMMLPFIFLCGHRRISQAGKLPGWENLIVSIEFLGTRLFEGPIF